MFFQLFKDNYLRIELRRASRSSTPRNLSWFKDGSRKYKASLVGTTQHRRFPPPSPLHPYYILHQSVLAYGLEGFWSHPSALLPRFFFFFLRHNRVHAVQKYSATVIGLCTFFGHSSDKHASYITYNQTVTLFSFCYFHVFLLRIDKRINHIMYACSMYTRSYAMVGWEYTWYAIFFSLQDGSKTTNPAQDVLTSGHKKLTRLKREGQEISQEGEDWNQ